MSQGARNWPFLTLTTLAGLRRRRPAGRSGGTGRPGSAARRRPRPTRAHCAALVHVGQDRQARALADLGEDRQRAVEADAALAARALVRLALSKLGLVDEADAEPAADLLQRAGHLQRVLRGFPSGRARRSARAAGRCRSRDSGRLSRARWLQPSSSLPERSRRRNPAAAGTTMRPRGVRRRGRHSPSPAQGPT